MSHVVCQKPIAERVDVQMSRDSDGVSLWRAVPLQRSVILQQCVFFWEVEAKGGWCLGSQGQVSTQNLPACPWVWPPTSQAIVIKQSTRKVGVELIHEVEGGIPRWGGD